MNFKEKMMSMQRSYEPGKSNDPDLGPYMRLPAGIWQNNGKQFGFNVIALPFNDARGYRVLTNKYKETLQFEGVDKRVPNRGVEPVGDVPNKEKCYESDDADSGQFETVDQFALTLDYIQEICQVEAKSSPEFKSTDGSIETGKIFKKIHHEPGLFLRMTEPVETTIQRKPTIRKVPLNLARLATIPHGNSVLAMGSCEILGYSDDELAKITDPDIKPQQTPEEAADAAMRDYLLIPKASFKMGMPQGTTQNLVPNGYLDPYLNTIIDPGTDEEFNPVLPQERLFQDLKDALGIDDFKEFGDEFPIKRTTKIYFDTDFATGGILNIPFASRQANAAAMRSTFWIHELDEPDANNEPKMIMQYLQSIFLDFHVIRSDDLPGRIRWPHISINTMFKGDKKPKYECDKD